MRQPRQYVGWRPPCAAAALPPRVRRPLSPLLTVVLAFLVRVSVGLHSASDLDVVTERRCRSADKRRRSLIQLTTQVRGQRLLVEFFYMSRCPNAAWSFKEYTPVLEKFASFVDVRLTHIGTLDGQGTAVTCMHGPEECLGNKQELCAQQKLQGNTSTLLRFVSCQMESQGVIPANGDACAVKAGLSPQDLNCPNAESLLVQSVKRSKAAEISDSCTVHLNGQVFCKEDGGEPWQHCSQNCAYPACLVNAICGALQPAERGPAGCPSGPPAVANTPPSPIVAAAGASTAQQASSSPVAAVPAASPVEPPPSLLPPAGLPAPPPAPPPVASQVPSPVAPAVPCQS